MLDCMTRMGEELTRLGTIVHPNFVMSTFVRQLHGDYSLAKQSLEEKEPDCNEMLKRANTKYNFIKSKPWETAFVAKGSR